MEYFIWNIDPEIFRIGSYGPRYYGLLFALGFLVGYNIMQIVFRQEQRKEEDLSSLLLYLMVSTIIGARLGHCLFYEPAHYLSNPIEILYVWRGGLASHGGSIGIAISLWLYSRKHLDQPLSWLSARLAAPVAFAAACIRIGNFFNSEIVGKPAELPWAIIFKQVDNIARHPSMLYEALCYFTLFVILIIRYKIYGKNLKPYPQIGILFVGAFTARFFIEFTKENQVGFENGMFFNMGQLLSIPFVVIGIMMITGLWAKIFPAAEPKLILAKRESQKNQRSKPQPTKESKASSPKSKTKKISSKKS